MRGVHQGGRRLRHQRGGHREVAHGVPSWDSVSEGPATYELQAVPGEEEGVRVAGDAGDEGTDDGRGVRDGALFGGVDEQQAQA